MTSRATRESVSHISVTRESADVGNEKPIIFTGESPAKILSGAKTQTRRVAKPVRGYEHNNVCRPDMAADPWAVWWHGEEERVGCLQDCPYGKQGDLLWVKEPWNYTRELTENESRVQAEILERFKSGLVTDIVEEALKLPNGTGQKRAMYAADFGEWAHDPDSDLKWRSSMFMPRWASRITLEITEVRVQRVQDISEEDARAEGVALSGGPWLNGGQHLTCRAAFFELWDSINTKRGYGWKTNPFVWAISYKRVQTESREPE